jgi:hypothetical protein
MAVISKGMKNAASSKHKMAFAVVEPSGELVAFARMDDTPYASVRLAQQKAPLTEEHSPNPFTSSWTGRDCVCFGSKADTSAGDV